MPSVIQSLIGLFAILSLIVPFSQPSSAADPIRIVAFGDSLTAGPGLEAEQTFPTRLEAALRTRGHNVSILNAGVSGDTTRDGLARLDWSIGEDADAVIVELGANDALRGTDPAIAHDALDAILTRLVQRGLPILLAGMVAPPNLGEDYATAFNSIFGDLATRHEVILYPFFLDGVAGDSRLNLKDGIHPNAAGVDIIVERITPKVESLIARIDETR